MKHVINIDNHCILDTKNKQLLINKGLETFQVPIEDIISIVIDANGVAIKKEIINLCSEYGVLIYFSDSKHTPEFNFKALTISKNGSVGEVFYQEDPFCATKDVIVMKPKFQFTNSIGIFISVILKLYFKTKFSYGRKITINKLNNAIIPLPLNVDKKTIDVTAIQLFMDDMKTDYYSNFEKSANLSEFLII